MTQDALAGDVLVQHATNAMLAHASDVAVLRQQLAAHRAALEAAYAALDALDAGLQPAAPVPGHAEWRAAKGQGHAAAN